MQRSLKGLYGTSRANKKALFSWCISFIMHCYIVVVDELTDDAPLKSQLAFAVNGSDRSDRR
jgi:hypothetical protein